MKVPQIIESFPEGPNVHRASPIWSRVDPEYILTYAEACYEEGFYDRYLHLRTVIYPRFKELNAE